MDYNQHTMQALGEHLIAGMAPQGVRLKALAEQNPDRLLFIARRPGEALAVAVSREALEDQGAQAATLAFAELLSALNSGGLRPCKAKEAAPLLGIMTSEGWQVMSGN